MRSSLNLSGTWRVTWTEGLHGRPEHAAAEVTDDARYIDVPVPCELHRALVDQGIIADPNVGIGSLSARWVEEQLWSYRTEFEAPAEALSRPASLCFDRPDLGCTIFLNGEEIGRHSTAHRPCRIDVTGRLRPGKNLLTVCIESGLYDTAEREGKAYNTAIETLLNKRQWMRKAQYQAGWDWNPRLINVGITGDVRLEYGDEPWIDQLVVLPTLSADHGSARLLVRAFVVNPAEREWSATFQAVAAVAEEGHVHRAETEVTLPPGETCAEATIEVSDPQLWWPVGHGSQTLYSVAALLQIEGEMVAERKTRTGIRSVKIDRSPHPETGEHFIIVVNGRRIFCKGGNWVPADMMVAGTPGERYRDLVKLAVDANFNMLRVWGGGVYVGDDLLSWCDEAGILVWHDLAFACSKYPADDPAFMAEVRREITWNVRDMASHPSLVVWCGNNELEWGAWAWGYDQSGRALPDYSLYHHVIPVILKQEDPSRPYWPSSPHSPDHVFPNDPTVGDQHPWSVTLGEFGVDFWHYRDFVDRFPNEGGVLGASSPATLRQCLGDAYAFRSLAWEHHDNAANFWRGEQCITYEAVRFWLGLDAAQMELEQYVFASALLQAEGLREYIDNYRRRMYTCSSAIFWMYNDSWPVTHGWTIVDYYLRKKLSYHPVRRAFRPVTVVVARDGDEVGVHGVNDGPQDWEGVLRFGVFAFAGGTPLEETTVVRLSANSSTLLARLPLERWRKLGLETHGAFGVLLADGRPVAQHRLLLERFSNLRLKDAEVKVEVIAGEARFRSDVFVWGLCLDLDGESPVADDAFDLLPGVEYVVPWEASLGVPRLRHTGNELVLGK
jgi:beta-mannosidase